MRCERGNTSTRFGRAAPRGRRTRVLVLLAVTLAAALGAAATASAQGPTVEQFRFTGIDDTFGDELSAGCGLDVTVDGDAHETHVFYADGR